MRLGESFQDVTRKTVERLCPHGFRSGGINGHCKMQGRAEQQGSRTGTQLDSCWDANGCHFGNEVTSFRRIPSGSQLSKINKSEGSKGIGSATQEQRNR